MSEASYRKITTGFLITRMWNIQISIQLTQGKMWKISLFILTQYFILTVVCSPLGGIIITSLSGLCMSLLVLYFMWVNVSPTYFSANYNSKMFNNKSSRHVVAAIAAGDAILHQSRQIICVLEIPWWLRLGGAKTTPTC